MKIFKKSIILFIALIGTVVFTISVSAVNRGNFTFDFSTKITGKTKFTLTKHYTDVPIVADTYFISTGKVSSKKDSYNIDLVKFLTKYTTPLTPADGKKRRPQFGTVKAGTYTINMRNQGTSPEKRTIKGYGTIAQD